MISKADESVVGINNFIYKTTAFTLDSATDVTIENLIKQQNSLDIVLVKYELPHYNGSETIEANDIMEEYSIEDDFYMAFTCENINITDSDIIVGDLSSVDNNSIFYMEEIQYDVMSIQE